jgi:hypothetical protein
MESPAEGQVTEEAPDQAAGGGADGGVGDPVPGYA